MRVLVTGAAGFIGQHTVRLLEEEGYTVLALDNNSEALEAMTCQNKILCDITSLDLPKAFVPFMPEAVIHLAAQSTVAKSVRYWRIDADINIMGTINVVRCCQDFKVMRIVYASSGGTIYGVPWKLPINEEAQLAPMSPYGISKMAGEFYVRISGIPFTVLRYPNVYGPDQPPGGEAGVIAIFIDRITRRLKPQIFGNGSKQRDYVHVSDVARANQCAVAYPGEGIFNVGSGHGTRDDKLFEMIAEEMHWEGGVDYVPDRPMDIHQIYLDARRIGEVMGWRPALDIKEGIKKTVEACYAIQRT